MSSYKRAPWAIVFKTEKGGDQGSAVPRFKRSDKPWSRPLMPTKEEEEEDDNLPNPLPYQPLPAPARLPRREREEPATSNTDDIPQQQGEEPAGDRSNERKQARERSNERKPTKKRKAETIHDEDNEPAEERRPLKSDGEERVCAKNYAAIDAEDGAYGLIAPEKSLPQDGMRPLLMHVPRGKSRQRPWDVLNQVRPGSILTVKRGERTRNLVVRFTTPARYYSPGAGVTTLSIGVDEAEWQDVLS